MKHDKEWVNLFDKKDLEPVDTCGCGDVGYLTLRTLPIDLAQGAGKIYQVPVYHCRDECCKEYTIPPAVARRMEELAEDMEASGAKELQFGWKPNSLSEPKPNAQNTIVQAFTLQFPGQEYEDARVILVVPGEYIFFQSKIDLSEHFCLHYEPEDKGKEIRFSFSKFYWDEAVFKYEDFLPWLENGYVKELGRVTNEEISDLLEDEFGCRI